MRDATKKEWLSLGAAARFTGLSVATLRRYMDSEKVTGYRTPSGQRRISRACRLEMQNNCRRGSDRDDPLKERRTDFLYARVSSRKQVDDLQRQCEFLRSHNSEYNSFDLVTDIASGINFKRPGLKKILDSCLQGTVGRVVVAHKDRLCRFGFDLLDHLVRKAGGTIIVVQQDEGQSSEQELAEDLMAIVHVFSCRQMGRRKYTITRGREAAPNNNQEPQSADVSNQQPAQGA